jgi:hypothetical protein
MVFESEFIHDYLENGNMTCPRCRNCNSCPMRRSAHAQKPAMLRYYKTGAVSLTDSNLPSLALKQDQQ